MSYYPWDVRQFMLGAMRNNMTNSGYVYIIPFPVKSQLFQPEPWKQNIFSAIPSNVSDEEAKQAFIRAYLVNISFVFYYFNSHF